MLGLALLGYLAFFHLERYPRLFFDEGSYLKVAKNLAQHGLYAESSTDGPIYYGGPVGIGPTVHLPVALAFSLAGAGLVQARFVIVAYMLGGLALFFLLARELGGTRLACAATVLLSFTPSIEFVSFGRQMMGEVPGFFFVTSGLFVWLRRWGSTSAARLIGAAALFGLAAVTKNQFAMMLAITFGAGFVSNALYYRLVPHRLFLVPLAFTVGFYVTWSTILLYVLIPEGREEILANGPMVAATATLIWPPLQQGAAALKELLRPGALFCLLVPALAYGLHRARERSLAEQRWAMVLTLVLADFSWFVLVSVGWRRYIFLGLALSSLLVARLLARVSSDFHLRFPAEARRPDRTRLAPLLRVAVLAWVAIGITVSAATLLRRIAFPLPANAAAMAAYIDANVPPGAVVETWEPEIAFFTDHPFHFPPSALMANAIAFTHFGAPPPYTSYDALAQRPPYLLAGEFSVLAGGYDYERVHQLYRPVQTFEPYVLFRRNSAS